MPPRARARTLHGRRLTLIALDVDDERAIAGPGALLCYANYSANADLVASTNGCYCSGWYGWSNYPACDELFATPAFNFVLGSTIVLSILFSCFAAMGTRELFLMQTARTVHSRASRISLVFAIWANVCMALYEMLYAVMAFRPTEADTFLPSATEKSGAYPIPTSVAYILGILFATLTSFNVAATFIEVAMAAEKLVMVRGHFLLKVVYVLEAFLTIALLANLLAGSYSYTLPICLVFMLAIIAAHARAHVMFNKLADSSSSSSVVDLLKAISWTALAVVVLSSIIIVLGIAWIAVSFVGWKSAPFGSCVFCF